ncbi:MAG: CvpA family protein [Clostridiales bacterium]|nr:CvpA family protein [Clostridiales bacterium]
MFGIFKGTNSILGGVFGAIKALLIIFIILTIVQIANITGRNDIRNTLNNTVVLKGIERFNPITGLLLKK